MGLALGNSFGRAASPLGIRTSFALFHLRGKTLSLKHAENTSTSLSRNRGETLLHKPIVISSGPGAGFPLFPPARMAIFTSSIVTLHLLCGTRVFHHKCTGSCVCPTGNRATINLFTSCTLNVCVRQGVEYRRLCLGQLCREVPRGPHSNQRLDHSRRRF